MLAVLYDIHGSLPALEAVLTDAERAGADAYLLGGDYGAWGPHPLECVERLRALPHTTWIRGNGERWTREPPLDRPEVVERFPAEEDERDEWMLAGVRDTTVVFGHSHLQFRRAGPNGTLLVNPGSVGMPLDGDVRAAYALRGDDGVIEFRRVEYDIDRAAA